jgi:hypothetical protein
MFFRFQNIVVHNSLVGKEISKIINFETGRMKTPRNSGTGCRQTFNKNLTKLAVRCSLLAV